MRITLPFITGRAMDPHAVAVIEIGMLAALGMVAMTLGFKILFSL